MPDLGYEPWVLARDGAVVEDEASAVLPLMEKNEWPWIDILRMP
jgi:hypothetical protein